LTVRVAPVESSDMRNQTSAPVVATAARAVVAFTLTLGAAIAALAATPPARAVWGGPFVIGAPGRPLDRGDRQQRRRLPASLTAARAYAEVEVVRDSTWLAQEIEAYVRRMTDCGTLTPAWCHREFQRVAGAVVIMLARGGRGELVWRSGADTAVRLGWRRIRETPTGTLTVDAPPVALATTLLARWPSNLVAGTFDEARERRWMEGEVDRFLFYADRLAPAVSGDSDPRALARFVADGLARLAVLPPLGRGVPPLEAAPADPSPAAAGRQDGLPDDLAYQLAELRSWRAGRGAAQGREGP